MFLSLLLTLLPAAPPAAEAAPEALRSDRAATAAVAEGWQARTEDSLSGLRDPRTLSDPAQVDHPSLMAETAEMKRMKRDRIDPRSAEGVQLKSAAATRVARACGQAMEQAGHCSVWKSISHSDSRDVPDLTDQVRRLL